MLGGPSSCMTQMVQAYATLSSSIIRAARHTNSYQEEAWASTLTMSDLFDIFTTPPTPPSQ